MEIVLTKKPKNPTIILGFPGFGLVGTIASEFIVEHLQTEKIGKIIVNDMPAMVAIHQGKVVDPLTIYYNKKYNLVLLHSISAPHNLEWDIAEQINLIVKELGVKEVICLEGVGTNQESKTTRTFYFTNNNTNKKKFEAKQIPLLDEGIIIGITGAVLSTVKAPISCVFVETHSNLPDSKAAACIIKVLDKYLGLQIDYKPLLDQAKKFEEKLKNLLSQGQSAQDVSKKKWLSYVG